MSISVYALPVLFTLFVWWLSTGIILIVGGLPRGTFRWSMLVATLLLFGAFYGLAASRNDASIIGAYTAFTCALVVWGWQETGFLLGFITGPRRISCPIDARGWRRAGLALQAILYHELAIIALACAVLALTWGGSNHVGTGTFMILWAMRQSAKLNLFLGVRNLSEEFLPPHLRYLESYFTRKPMNVLLPVSLIASMTIAWIVWQRALSVGVDAVAATGCVFLGALLALGILEHLFLVMPFPATSLWRWSLRSQADRPVRVPVSPVPEAIHAIPRKS